MAGIERTEVPTQESRHPLFIRSEQARHGAGHSPRLTARDHNFVFFRVLCLFRVASRSLPDTCGQQGRFVLAALRRFGQLPQSGIGEACMSGRRIALGIRQHRTNVTAQIFGSIARYLETSVDPDLVLPGEPRVVRCESPSWEWAIWAELSPPGRLRPVTRRLFGIARRVGPPLWWQVVLSRPTPQRLPRRMPTLSSSCSPTTQPSSTYASATMVCCRRSNLMLSLPTSAPCPRRLLDALPIWDLKVGFSTLR